MLCTIRIKSLDPKKGIAPLFSDYKSDVLLIKLLGNMAGTRGLEPLHAVPDATSSFQDYGLTN